MDELTDYDPMPVKGIHEGTKMMDVPAKYLDWLDDQGWLAGKYPLVKDYIKRSRSAIDKELKEQGII